MLVGKSARPREGGGVFREPQELRLLQGLGPEGPRRRRRGARLGVLGVLSPQRPLGRGMWAEGLRGLRRGEGDVPGAGAGV